MSQRFWNTFTASEWDTFTPDEWDTFLPDASGTWYVAACGIFVPGYKGDVFNAGATKAKAFTPGTVKGDIK